MIKETLRQFIKTREAFNGLQHKLRDELNTWVPDIETSSLSNLRRTINQEFDIFLAATMKFKSNRIILKRTGKDDYYGNKYIMTISPGLKRPHTSYTSLSFVDVEEVKPNGDILVKKETGSILMGVLRKDKRIHQDKLDRFYSALRESVTWFQKHGKVFSDGAYYDYDDEDNDGGDDLPGQNLKSKGIEIRPRDTHFRIIAEKKQYEIDSHEIENYSGTDRDYGQPSMEELHFMLENFDLIEVLLKQTEVSKARYITDMNNMLKKLQAETAGFKLLHKLGK